MNKPSNDIDALLAALDWGPGALTNEEMLDRSHAALTALVAERNALKQRVAELEAEPSSELSFCERRDRAWAEELRKPAPADRDRELRERDKAMALWMEEVTKWLGLALSYCGAGRGELGTRCDAAIAAMRKENDNA